MKKRYRTDAENAATDDDRIVLPLQALELAVDSGWGYARLR